MRKAILVNRYVLKTDSLEQIVNTIETMIKNMPPENVDYN